MRAVLALLICGCFSPDIGEGALVCGDNHLCPEGFSCAGNHCYQNPPPIDAPVDGSGMCAHGGFLACSGDDLLLCAGDSDAGITHCDFGCNQAAGQCNVCRPNTPACDSQGKLLTCAPNGLSQTLTTCPSDDKDCTIDICMGGACGHMNVTDGTSCNDAPGGSTGACSMGNCVCGDAGQPCCNGSSCNNALQCMNMRCGSCGAMNQPCCAGQACGPGFVCSANMCQPCGASNQLCCTNSSCDSGFNCGASHCTACGALNEACCMTGPQCSGTLGCVNNTCQCIPTCNGKACGADDGCGNPCQTGTCSQGGTHCVNGQCRCDMVSCGSGCCDNNVCQPGTSPSDCGSGGRQCSMCIAACVSHACL